MKTDIVKAIKFQLEDITCPVILMEVRLVRFPKYQFRFITVKVNAKEKRDQSDVVSYTQESNVAIWK